MPLAPGSVLNNRYRIDRLLGQGGFGAVYAARDLQLDGPCAVKENLETSPAAQAQFSREARLLFNLRHPNLPRVFDHFVVPGQGQYLVMDYIEGEDLRTLLERQGGPLPLAQVLPWLVQVCDALTYMHTRTPPVIHRDIKPANIRITPEGQAVLVDFGIAKSFEASKQTSTGARALTPGFAPPEQYGAGLTDPQSDVYALGATAYNLLTGQAPPESVMLMTGAETLTPAHVLNPAIPPGVSLAISQALQCHRPQRTRSAAEFKAALLAGARQQVVAAVAPAGVAQAAPVRAPGGTVIAPAAPLSQTVSASAAEGSIPAAPARKLGPLPLAAGLALGGGLLLIGIVCVVLVVAGLLRGGSEARLTEAPGGGGLAVGTQVPEQATTPLSGFTTPVVEHPMIRYHNYQQVQKIGSFTPQAEGHPVGAVEMLWTPDSSLLALMYMTSSNTGGVAFFDRQNWQLVQNVAFTGLGIAMAISPDGTILAVGFSDQKIAMYDIASATLRSTILDRGQPDYLAFSPDGSLLAASNGTIRLYQVADAGFVNELKAEGQQTSSIVFFPKLASTSNRILASGTVQGKVILWDYQSGRDIFNWTMASDKIQSVAVAANGAQVLTASLDGTLAWHPFTIEDTVTVFKGHTRAAGYAAFNPAVDLVISGGWDCSIRIWMLDGTLLRTLQEISEQHLCRVALSPDGTLIASQYVANHDITLWGVP